MNAKTKNLSVQMRIKLIPFMYFPNVPAKFLSFLQNTKAQLPAVRIP